MPEHVAQGVCSARAMQCVALSRKLSTDCCTLAWRLNGSSENIALEHP